MVVTIADFRKRNVAFIEQDGRVYSLVQMLIDEKMGNKGLPFSLRQPLTQQELDNIKRTTP